jgi:hypothetical protein
MSSMATTRRSRLRRPPLQDSETVFQEQEPPGAQYSSSRLRRRFFRCRFRWDRPVCCSKVPSRAFFVAYVSFPRQLAFLWRLFRLGFRRSKSIQVGGLRDARPPAVDFVTCIASRDCGRAARGGYDGHSFHLLVRDRNFARLAFLELRDGHDGYSFTFSWAARISLGLL